MQRNSGRTTSVSRTIFGQLNRAFWGNGKNFAAKIWRFTFNRYNLLVLALRFCALNSSPTFAMNKINPTTCAATNGGQVIIPDPKRITVLYFYPKDSTPGCTIEGQNFRDLHGEFTKHNAVIYGVSRDTIKRHENFRAKQNFPFELISDEDETLCRAFDVIRAKKLFGHEYMGIVRSTFVLDPAGLVLKHWDKVKVRGHAAEVLEFVCGYKP